MYQTPIRIDTLKDAQAFVNLAAKLDQDVTLTDGTHNVNGKSLLGCLYSMEFDEIFLQTESPVGAVFEQFSILA